MADRTLTPGPGGGRALLAAFLVYLAAVLVLDQARGAFSSDLCAFEDEPAHAVTGMMARDWVCAGLPPPLDFARDYYLHYPKVAIGQWPPLFYGVLALWTLPFGSSTVSLLTLMAALIAGGATLLFAALRREVGWAAAALAGALYLALPSVQSYGAMVMTEAPLALLCTGAALCFGRFLEGGRARDALAFGALAGMACLTKGNALALAGVPPLATALAGRWDRWRRPALWGAAALVALLAAPWYAITLGISQTSWAGGSGPSGEYASAALSYYGRGLVRLGGWALLAAAVLGAVTGRRAGREIPGQLAALIAWPLCLLLLHGVVPSSLDERHLVLLAPALCALAVTGAARLVGGGARGAAFAALGLFGLLLAERGELPAKAWRGFDAAARELASDEELRGTGLLVLSDVAGEGAFVAAVAQADARHGRPGHYVLRASKALAHSDWLGRGYELRFDDAAALAEWLERVSVAVVIQDLAPKPRQRFEHHDQLARALALHPERWCESRRADLVKGGVRHVDALIVWRRVGPLTAPTGLDAAWLLGHDLPRF